MVVVLGMHRSGTSCLAGCLEGAGLHLGEVNTQAPYNARGNRENRAIMDLNDAVLAANGGAWDRPPDAVQWNDDLRARRDAIISAYPSTGVWGFKEPRTLLTFDGWLDGLPMVQPVGTFRHPTAVADSLLHRNGFRPEQAHALWLAYNRRLRAYWERLRFPLVCFDWEPSQYAARLSAISQDLGLADPHGGPAFYESDLRRSHPQTGTLLPAEVRGLYDRLREIAE